MPSRGNAGRRCERGRVPDDRDDRPRHLDLNDLGERLHPRAGTLHRDDSGALFLARSTWPGGDYRRLRTRLDPLARAVLYRHLRPRAGDRGALHRRRSAGLQRGGVDHGRGIAGVPASPSPGSSSCRGEPTCWPTSSSRRSTCWPGSSCRARSCPMGSGPSRTRSRPATRSTPWRRRRERRLTGRSGAAIADRTWCRPHLRPGRYCESAERGHAASVRRPRFY